MRKSRHILSALVSVLISLFVFPGSASAAKNAQYSTIDYDVVYVRCPRAAEPVNWKGISLLNWNGVNDMWLSASNNIYHQPGCDLVLHHSDPAYGGGLPAGDRGREEVLVECDESNSAAPICSIADPNVSFDGNTIVYTKFTDTRNFISDVGITGDGGWGQEANHSQSYVELYPNGDGPGYGKRFSSILRAYDAPALVFKYDLTTKLETQISPNDQKFAGHAIPGKSADWSSNIPVMDTGPFFMPDGRIGFTSNRENGFYRFQLFAMDQNGKNMEVLGHRAMNQQLHPNVLKDGRIAYTSFDAMQQKVANNNYSLFTVNPDGSFPFILAGKHDATKLTYHYTTQLSDGDVVTTLYYNHNNGCMGTLLRFPIDPAGPDFENTSYAESWRMGNSVKRFTRVGEYHLTPQASAEDSAQKKYLSSADFWNHPSRTVGGTSKTIGTTTVFTDKALVEMMGRFTHPSGAPDNDLLVTYTIGSSSTMGGYTGSLPSVMETIGKDAGIWLIPMEPNGTRAINHIADDGRIVVDFPEYHEIYPRALVNYNRIYGVIKPGKNPDGTDTQYVKINPNLGIQDKRIPAGAPYGLSGASSLYDRETRALNGTPWNMMDGGGYMSGRTYMNLAASGAELAIFDNEEVYGVRVVMPLPSIPSGYGGGIERWSGAQAHHMRILGEFPIRKADGSLLDAQGNPDTSFIVKIPANTPFFFQSIDKHGMALDLETTARSVTRGEQQMCIGCHVHTREGMNPFTSNAKLQTDAPFGNFGGSSAPLFAGLDGSGNPVVELASTIYSEAVAPGVTSRKSFAIDWDNGISQIFESRCSSCHGEGQSAQVLTGLRLDGNRRTFDLLSTNKYTREDGVSINDATKPGDGLNDVKNNTAGTDRITKRYQCCSDSRWLSFNSARSSMLVWALYGERLDGRNPDTGLPWGAAGETVPADKQGLTGVPVDADGREFPEVWPKVAEHLQYVASMPESEKRLIARWIDIGAPKLNVHDDLVRPVITVTPVKSGGEISSVLLGLWDDSQLDYASLKVTLNGSDITPTTTGTEEVVQIILPTPINDANATSTELAVEVWDKPNRSYSLNSPGTSASNRSTITLNGAALIRKTGGDCSSCVAINAPSKPGGVILQIVR